MAPGDFALLQPRLESVALALNARLVRPGIPIPAIHFVESGIVSSIALAPDGERIELAVVGREGMIGVPLLLGTDQTPHEVCVQASGLAWALPAEALHEALARSSGLQSLLLRYAQAANIQVACTALVNGRYKLDRRLARWLLMCHDRVDGDVLPATHRFLSLMLGVNRTGLTGTVSSFVRDGLIETKRGNITIRDRTRLLALAGAAYGQAEAEYERLLDQAGPVG